MKILVGFGVVLGLLLVLIISAFNSETVFRQVASMAKGMAPGSLDYKTVSGTLSGPIAFTDLDYTVADTHITADLLSFDIGTGKLLGGNIDLGDVHGRNVSVTLPPPSNETPANDTPTQPRDVIQALQLPVSISADNIVLDGFALRSDTGETLFELDRLKARLEWNDQRLDVPVLDANGPLLDAKGRLEIGLAEKEQTRVSLDARWRGFEFPLAAHVEAQGTPGSLKLDADIHAPADASLHATLTDLLDTPSWQGRLDVREARPATFAQTLPANTWSGSLDFQGNWQDTQFTLDANGDWPPVDGIALDARGKVNAERLDVAKLEARVERYDANLAASGELHYAGGLRYDVKGNIAQAALPQVEGLSVADSDFTLQGNSDQLEATLDLAAGGGLADGRLQLDGAFEYSTRQFDAVINARTFALDAGGTPVRLQDLSATVAGQPDDYRARITTDATVAGLPRAHLETTLEGNLAGLDADISQLQWLKGEARGRVAVNWQEALALDAALKGQDFDLAALDPQLDASVGGNVTASADFSGAQPDIRVQLKDISGNVSGVPLDGSGSLRYTGGDLQSEGLELSSGPASLELRGSRQAGIDFALRARDLSRFHATASGSIDAKGWFNGDFSSPGLRFEATGNDVGFGEWRMNAFDLEAAMAEGGKRTLTLGLEAGNVRTPAMNAELLDLVIDGKLAAHDVRLVVTGAGNDESGGLAFAAHGGYREERQLWQGELTQLELQHPETGSWQLRKENIEGLSVGASALELPAFCLDGPEGSACIGPVSRNGDQWNAKAELNALPVSAFAGLLPAALDYAGAINGRIEVSRSAAGLDGSAQLDLGEGGIRQVAGEGFETLLGWQSGSATVTFDGRVARGELLVDLDGGDRITGSGRLDVPAEGAMALDAGIQAHIENLQLLPSLVPELSRLRGVLTADLDIIGPLSRPRIRGKAELKDATARILSLGTTWENINLTLTGEGREIAVTGHVDSGEGSMDVNLEGRDTPQGFAGKAQITGVDFKAIETPEANVNVSPRLHLSLEGRDLYIDGEVLVPFARIEPRDLSTAVQPSEDQVIVNREKETAANALRIHTAVTTRLGEDVRVSAFGLKARLEGKLTVAQEPQSRPIGTGRLVIVEGEYKAYGQDLTLAKGEIIYTGQPLSNPGLDIRAERTIEPDITAGVSVRGPLSEPTANIYSDPAMTETEALSYLLFGRPIQQVTGEQETQVSNASLALNLGGQKLLGRVGQKLGVEEFRIDAMDSRDRASLVLGKYLSPDLYVSYGIGLFEAVNTFQVRYRLSSKWTLEAVSGLKSSADLLYTIER